MKQIRHSFRLPALLLAMILLAACALPTASVWADDTAENTETGEDENTIMISSGAELEAFAENCVLDTWSEGLTVVLTKDIDLTATDFVSIPVFAGTFDGNGHTISGFKLTDSLSPAGFFGIVQSTGLVKNLNLKGTVSPDSADEQTGGITGINYGQITGCSFKGAAAGKTATGGIAGANEASGTITNCSVSGYVTGNEATGGIAGRNSGIIQSCSSSAEINTTESEDTASASSVDLSVTEDILDYVFSKTGDDMTDTGGIAGYNSGVILNCTNSGSVGYPHVGYNAGGIAGLSCGYIDSCSNSGAINGRKDIGGVVGQSEPYLVTEQVTDYFTLMRSLTSNLSAAVTTVSDTAGTTLGSTSGYMSSMSGYLQSTGDVLQQIINELDSSGTVPDPSDPSTITGSVTDDEKSALSNAISGMSSTTQSFAGTLSGSAGELQTEMNQVNSIATQLMGTMISAMESLSNSSLTNVLSDTSADDPDSVLLGKTKASSNSGTVAGDINVGGVTGSMSVESSLDPEDDLSTNLGDLSAAEYEVKVILQDCSNTGSVSSKRSYAGGLCGRMTLGLIQNCTERSTVSSELGSYVGGIAGDSEATVRNCCSGAILSGDSYIGGILGCAEDGSAVSGCLAMADITASGGFTGAISGSKAGTFTENYFVSDDLTGINGVNYSGRAEEVSYDHMRELTDFFDTLILKFVCEGETLKTINFVYGESFTRSDYPIPEEREGCTVVWDRNQLDDLHFDTVVTAEYTDFDTVLAGSFTRSSGRPVFLVEGSFSPDAVLADGKLSPMAENEEDWSLSLPDDGQTSHLIRYLPEGEGKPVITLSYKDGTVVTPKLTQVGSCWCFEAEGNTFNVTVQMQETDHTVLLIAAAAGLVLLLVLLLLLLKRKKRKTAAADTVDEESPAMTSEEPEAKQKNKTER